MPRDAARSSDTIMSKGGARNRSGPSPDPISGRSDARGLVFTALPSEGYAGEAPAFPLEPIVLFVEYFEGTGADRVKIKNRDDGRTEGFREREAAVWAEAWRTPQACAWALAEWRWPVVAEYCRLKTVVEFDPTASASLVNQLHRYRDQIGLTPAGLKENGWAVATNEVGRKANERRDEPAGSGEPAPRRLRAAGDGAH